MRYKLKSLERTSANTTPDRSFNAHAIGYLLYIYNWRRGFGPPGPHLLSR